MNTLIHALNRIQHMQKFECPQPMGLLEDKTGGKESPGETQTTRMEKGGAKPSGIATSKEGFTLPLAFWAEVLRYEYLKKFIREGGAAIKFGVLADEKAFKSCQQRLEDLAHQESYVHARVDSRFSKVHMVEKIFHKIAKQLDWDDLAYRFMIRLLEDNGYHIPANRQEFSLHQIAALNERKEPMLRRDVQTWLEKAIEDDTGMCREFRMAMMRLCLAQLDAGDTDKVLGTAVKEWLCGDLRLVSGVKKALIYQKVARHNARHMLSSLTRWLRLTGKGGLLLTVDISQYFMGRGGGQDGTLSFSPSATMDLYELLRQFLDATDDIEGLLMIVLAPGDLLSDPRRGLDRYEPLKMRIWDEVRPKHRQNPLTCLVRLREDLPTDSVSGSGTLWVRSQDALPDLEARRVIEGLRAGVPNRHVVSALGCGQPEVEGRFRRLLEATQNNVTSGVCPKGMVIEGEFGSGKSHVLEYLQSLALEANFICSRIVISKETPFYHPVRLFYSAIESTVIPNKRGEVFAEIAGECDVWSPRYKDLVGWLNNPENGIDSRFAATLFLYERMSSDLELGHRMARFWTGDPIGVGDLKKYLQEAGFGNRYRFGKISATELAQQRFQFAARLMQAAGYAGWILFIDEVELIGRYAMNQRAKSYAEITRLMPMDGGASLPGLGTVLALTDDFREEILEKKGDAGKLLQKLRAPGTEDGQRLADNAEKGMQLLRSQRIPVGRPSTETIQDIHRTVRSLHVKGHGWHMWEQATDAPAHIIPGINMRRYVKSWVTQWDLHRFFPDEECELEATPYKLTYQEEEAERGSPPLHSTVGPNESMAGHPPLDSLSQEAAIVEHVFSSDTEPPSGIS